MSARRHPWTGWVGLVDGTPFLSVSDTYEDGRRRPRADVFRSEKAARARCEVVVKVKIVPVARRKR